MIWVVTQRTGGIWRYPHSTANNKPRQRRQEQAKGQGKTNPLMKRLARNLKEVYPYPLKRKKKCISESVKKNQQGTIKTKHLWGRKAMVRHDLSIFSPHSILTNNTPTGRVESNAALSSDKNIGELLEIHDATRG